MSDTLTNATREHSYSSFEMRQTQKGTLFDIKVYFDGDSPEALMEALKRYDLLHRELTKRAALGD